MPCVDRAINLDLDDFLQRYDPSAPKADQMACEVTDSHYYAQLHPAALLAKVAATGENGMRYVDLSDMERHQMRRARGLYERVEGTKGKNIRLRLSLYARTEAMYSAQDPSNTFFLRNNAA